MKSGDKIMLLGTKYMVVRLSKTNYSLSNISASFDDDIIFKNNNIDKIKLSKDVLGYYDGDWGFPFCRSLKDLEKLIDVIKEIRGKDKVDITKVKQKEHKEEKAPISELLALERFYNGYNIFPFYLCPDYNKNKE